MKRILACLLMLAGFILAGCEKEVIREYPRPYRGYRHREFRLSDETLRSDQLLQTESVVEP